MKNIFILAAENSAEKYGALLLEQFKKSKTKYRFFGAGGDKFKDLGVDLIVHSRELSIVGIIEVIGHLFKLKKYMDLFLKAAGEKRCDAAILIDYPDFNLRLAKKFKKLGIPVYYYISPTVWAWRYNRIKTIKKYVDHLFVIFPFEKEIYEKEDIPFTYTGHPLLGQIKRKISNNEFKKKYGIKKNEKILTLLPGSRMSEISSLFPVMLNAYSNLVEKISLKIFILKADSVEKKVLEKHLSDKNINASIIDQTEGYDLIGSSDAVISTCGTSNLEIAVLGTPFVAVYKVNGLSYILGRGFLKISNYSIVNILLNKKVVDELIQNDFTEENVTASIEELLVNKSRIREMKSEFKKVKNLLKLESIPSKIIFDKIETDLMQRFN